VNEVSKSSCRTGKEYECGPEILASQTELPVTAPHRQREDAAGGEGPD